ncbi:MAG: response regulator [Verrucomicrobiota bacterium]|nr:response regulator [Verrucomicrobiota bacterium]
MTAAPDLPQVLVIDDEIGPRESLRMLLKPNYEVHTANSVEAGIRLLREKKPDAVISDIRMPGTNGIDGLRLIREIDPHVAVIMLTGFGALETAQEALRLGANDYISKPFDARQMRDVIGRNVERTRLHRTSEHAAEEIRELNSRLLKELAQKERLASLGQASAEFVHDLGNPLTIVWGYVQLLGKKLEASEKEGVAGSTSAKELNIIEQNVRLCRELLTMWQSYGSVEAAAHRPISISQIVREVVKGVESIATQNSVSLTINTCDQPCTVMGDPLQLQRAIQNVVVNGVQAAAERDGTVAVTCENREFYVDVRVEDTGMGIQPAQISKIFEPYFTTRQGKSGTGLGLYITKKVVEDHQGSIKVDSTPDVGTTFTIRLPLAGS